MLVILVIFKVTFESVWDQNLKDRMRSWGCNMLVNFVPEKIKINNIYNLQSKLLVYNKQKPVRSIWRHKLCKCCWICVLYLRIRFLKGQKKKKCYMIDLRKKPNSSGGVKIIWIHVFQATWSFSPLLKCILFCIYYFQFIFITFWTTRLILQPRLV